MSIVVRRNQNINIVNQRMNNINRYIGTNLNLPKTYTQKEKFIFRGINLTKLLLICTSVYYLNSANSIVLYQRVIQNKSRKVKLIQSLASLILFVHKTSLYFAEHIGYNIFSRVLLTSVTYCATRLRPKHLKKLYKKNMKGLLPDEDNMQAMLFGAIGGTLVNKTSHSIQNFGTLSTTVSSYIIKNLEDLSNTKNPQNAEQILDLMDYHLDNKLNYYMTIVIKDIIARIVAIMIIMAKKSYRKVINGPKNTVKTRVLMLRNNR